MREYCKKCFIKLALNDKFKCSNCGAKLHEQKERAKQPRQGYFRFQQAVQ